MSVLKPIHIIKSQNVINTASVIFLHGSGDSAKSFLEWVQFLDKDFGLPHVKFIFPTAPTRPYTPLDGELSRVWFNRLDISPEVPEHEETLLDIKTKITTLVKEEIDSGIPLNKIVIGGFSMGGTLALHTAFRFLPGFAGVFALSSFLNNESAVYKSAQALDTPLLMCHGDRDSLVPLEWGKETFERLQKLGVKGEFVPLENTMHEIKRKELDKLIDWITNLLPAKE